jgi:hypothetical protein
MIQSISTGIRWTHRLARLQHTVANGNFCSCEIFNISSFVEEKGCKGWEESRYVGKSVTYVSRWNERSCEPFFTLYWLRKLHVNRFGNNLSHTRNFSHDTAKRCVTSMWCIQSTDEYASADVWWVCVIFWNATFSVLIISFTCVNRRTNL